MFITCHMFSGMARIKTHVLGPTLVSTAQELATLPIPPDMVQTICSMPLHMGITPNNNLVY